MQRLVHLTSGALTGSFWVGKDNKISQIIPIFLQYFVLNFSALFTTFSNGSSICVIFFLIFAFQVDMSQKSHGKTLSDMEPECSCNWLKACLTVTQILGLSARDLGSESDTDWESRSKDHLRAVWNSWETTLNSEEIRIQ